MPLSAKHRHYWNNKHRLRKNFPEILTFRHFTHDLRPQRLTSFCLGCNLRLKFRWTKSIPTFPQLKNKRTPNCNGMLLKPIKNLFVKIAAGGHQYINR